MCGTGDRCSRSESCRDMVLSARWGPPAAHPQQRGGPQQAAGRDVGTQEVARGWQTLLGFPRYSREGRGDPSRRGSRAVLEVPVPEEKNAEPTQRTSVPPSPPLTPLTGSPLAPASPAGPRSPCRPFGGRREELQGISCSPPGLRPPGSTTGQSAGDKDQAQVCDLHQPTAPACPAPPGTEGTRSSPSRASCTHRHWAQRPSDAHTQAQVTAATCHDP